MSVCTGTPPVIIPDRSGTCHNEDIVEPDTVGGTGGIDQENSGQEIPKKKQVMQCHLSS